MPRWPRVNLRLHSVNESDADNHHNRAYNPNCDLYERSSAPIQRRVEAIVESEQEERHEAQEIEMRMRRHRRVIPRYTHLDAPDHAHYNQHDPSLEA